MLNYTHKMQTYHHMAIHACKHTCTYMFQYIHIFQPPAVYNTGTAKHHNKNWPSIIMEYLRTTYIRHNCRSVHFQIISTCKPSHTCGLLPDNDQSLTIAFTPLFHWTQRMTRRECKCGAVYATRVAHITHTLNT